MRKILQLFHGKLWLRLLLRRGLRWSALVGALAALVFAIALGAAHWWLPGVGIYKAQVEQRLSAMIAHPVSIREVAPHWDGLYPGIALTDVNIAPATNVEPALRLRRATVSIAWLPLLWGELRVHRLRLVNPDIALERLADGRLRLPGFAPFVLGKKGDGRFAPWLFAQRNVVIVGGVFHWRDARSDEPPLAVTEVELSLHNAGNRHHIEFNARWPASLCQECGFSIDLIGDPLVRSEWGGQAHLRARGLFLQYLPAMVREYLPQGLAGRIDARLSSQWDNGLPFAVSGRVAIDDLQVPENRWSKPAYLHHASADVLWRRSDDEWSAQLGNVLVGTGERPWIKGALRFAQDPTHALLDVDYLDMAALMPVIAKLEHKARFLETVKALDPKGELRELRVRVHGAWPQIETFSVHSQVANAAMEPYLRFPGVKGISGRAAITQRGGKFTVTRYDGELSFPHVFVAPIAIAAGKGEIAWKRTDAYWELSGKELNLRNPNVRANGEFVLQLPSNKGRSARLKLHAQVPELNGVQAERYLPTNILKDNVRAWLQRFIVSGVLVDTQIKLEGELREFPFNNGGGKFEVRGKVRDGVFNYLPGWPNIESANADLLFSGSEVLVNGRGRIRGLDVTAVSAHIRDLRAPDGAVAHIRANASGPFDEGLELVRTAQDEKWSRLLPADMYGVGAVAMGLDLSVPLRRPKAFALKFDTRVQDAALHWPAAKLDITQLTGAVEADQTGIHTGALRARMLGGETTVAIAKNVPLPGIRVDLTGKVTRAGLEQAVGAKVADLVQGSADWKATIEAHDGIARLGFDADLKALALSLPPPLMKSVGVPWRLTVRSELSERDMHVIDAQLSGHAAAKFAFERKQSGWTFARARVHLGEGRALLPPAPGVHLSVNWPFTDGDRWSQLAQNLTPPMTATQAAHNDILPPVFNRLTLDIAALEMLYRPWGRVVLDLNKASTGWSGTVRGSTVSGDIAVSGYAHNRVWQLNFDQLTVPAKRDVTELPTPARELRNLPTVHAQAKSFHWGNTQLGRMALWALPHEGGWRIQHFVLSRPEMNVFAKGNWSIAGTQQKTDLDVEFKSDNIGATLAALNLPNQVQGGTATVTAKLAWDGGPAAFSLGQAQATVAVNAEKGQFLKIKQGAGKLLGLFDVSSLSRYLSLDFSSIFGGGYVFNRLQANIAIERGNAITRDLNIDGPSADIDIRGRVGIVGEDFDLEVGVSPHLRGSIALVGGIAGGPVGLGTALLIERVFKKQIASGTRLIYTVQGEWANPVVRRVITEPSKEGG